jgi:hypothetical protein
MLLGAQFLAALHFLLAPHTIDAQTGKVVHVVDQNHQTKRKPKQHPDDSTPEHGFPAPQECQVHTLLQQAKTLTSPTLALQPASIVEVVVPPAVDSMPRHRLRVYRVSPAQSPPVLGLS